VYGEMATARPMRLPEMVWERNSLDPDVRRNANAWSTKPMRMNTESLDRVGYGSRSPVRWRCYGFGVSGKSK
jgi:hypothetical protein